jgi:hypothetical protein
VAGRLVVLEQDLGEVVQVGHQERVAGATAAADGPRRAGRDFAADRCDEAPASRCSGTSQGGVEHGTPTVTGVPLQEGAVMLRWLT